MIQRPNFAFYQDPNNDITYYSPEQSNALESQWMSSPEGVAYSAQNARQTQISADPLYQAITRGISGVVNGQEGYSPWDQGNIEALYNQVKAGGTGLDANSDWTGLMQNMQNRQFGQFGNWSHDSAQGVPKFWDYFYEYNGLVPKSTLINNYLSGADYREKQGLDDWRNAMGEATPTGGLLGAPDMFYKFAAAAASMGAAGMAGAGAGTGEAVSGAYGATAGELAGAGASYAGEAASVWNPSSGMYEVPTPTPSGVPSEWSSGGFDTAGGGTAYTGPGAGTVGPATVTGANPGIFEQFAQEFSKNPISNTLKAAQAAMGIFGGAAGLTGLGGGTKALSGAAALSKADPWAEYRPQYARRLNELYDNPNLTMSEPGYQFQRQQGEQGVLRNASKAGMNNSGNVGIGLSQYNQNYALNAFNNLTTRYAALAGANANPANGVDAFLKAQQQGQSQNDNNWKAISQGVGSLATFADPIVRNRLGGFASENTGTTPYTGSAQTVAPFGYQGGDPYAGMVNPYTYAENYG